ncbi:dynein axonemal assembly factor 9-like [Ostrea edulis]|uniref:dynein axonemal assembly factor 9-like n=1 Tax=Ostrea edulis TaxID=37623 RepID=UPI0024AF9FCB|nr:dynein axonemal assembly factor 9-like [Ostrea edulis]
MNAAVMSLKFKRPSSARRHIKLETFSSFVSGARLRRVQELLKSEEIDNKPDAILCIAGIDSRYHEGSTELIDYLLFGFFERRKAELEQSGFEEEVIDDLIVLIRKHEVDVYCNPVNYHYLLPYVAHWRNLRFHCLSDAEYEDEEAAEEYKIQSFIAMVQGVRKVAIPHNVIGLSAKFDHMLIEKWPIIQAYALEDYKGGGFFTLQHEVVDIGPQLSEVYSQMDPCTLEVLLTEQMTQFERQWQTLIDNLDVNIATGIDRLTEEKVCEPLQSYYKHGKVGSQGTKTMERQRQPFVLCGTNSRRKVLDDVRSCKISVNSEISQCGISNGPAKFMVCHGISPRGPLCCTRTYFLNEEPSMRGARATLQSKTDGGTPADTVMAVEDQDTKMLVDMYSIMVDSVLEGIKQYSKTLSVHKTRAMVVDQICEGCRTYPVLNKYIQRRSDIVFTLEAYDQDGRNQSVEEGSRSLMLKSASICLYDVPSTLIPSKTLGSLVFSEIFQDSVISVQREDGTLELSGETLVLTSFIPRYKNWPLCSKMDPSSSLHSLEKYGCLLLPGETVRVCTNRNLTQPVTAAELYAYESAIVLVFQRAITLSLDKDSIMSMQMFVGETSEALSVLMVKVSPSSSIPAFLQSDDGIIYITMVPKSKAKLCLFQEVLPKWKSQDSLPEVNATDSIPQSFQQIAEQLQLEFDNDHRPASPYHHIKGKFYNLDRFMTHLSVSSVTSHPTTSLPIMLQEAEEVETVAQEGGVINEAFHGITVTVLGGIPGSHKDQLCDTLLYLTESQIRWTVLKQTFGKTKSLINGELQDTLSKMWSAMRRRLRSAEISNRLLLITPGYTNIIDVLCAILNHPNPDVQQHVRIGSVTICIDPFVSFIEHRLTFPNLLDQCAQGFVNNILITSATSIQQNSSLEVIQTLLRSVNSDVAFFLAEKGNVKRSMDVDAILSETAFMENKKVRAREMLSPGWSQGLNRTPLSFTIQDTELTFSQPLVRNLFINKLRELRGLLTHYPFSGNIFMVQGQVSFTDSEDLMDVLYIVKSDQLTVTKHADNSVANGDGLHLSRNKFCLVVSGHKLQVTQIKDWLRSCGRQKPEMKKLVTKKDLTKDEIKKIHKQHHLDTLPAGWFYNGTQFVSFDGEKQDLHPSLETFIQEYVDSINREIEDHNDKVRKNAGQFVDLFA